MKYLLDTHTLLWGLYNSSDLSHEVIKILSNESCFISIASLWEMAIKKQFRKTQPFSTYSGYLFYMQRIWN